MSKQNTETRIKCSWNSETSVRHCSTAESVDYERLLNNKFNEVQGSGRGPIPPCASSYSLSQDEFPSKAQMIT